MSLSSVFNILVKEAITLHKKVLFIDTKSQVSE